MKALSYLGKRWVWQIARDHEKNKREKSFASLKKKRKKPTIIASVMKVVWTTRGIINAFGLDLAGGKMLTELQSN